MNADERRQRIEHLYNVLRERPLEERSAFLEDACGADETLRKEVESRIAQADSADLLIDRAATAAVQMQTSANRSLIGRQLGVYHVLTRLGAGGMGEVYRARDTNLERDVAIKVLPGALTADSDRLKRFEREARMLAALNHPNIAQIYGFERNEGVHALIMELVEGPTLLDRIANGPISLREALPIARQVVDALECAHEKGIIHRDLKPANVKVRHDGTVKVLDFGLAKAISGADSTTQLSQQSTIQAESTQVGMLVGTPAYMSPEQVQGYALDERTDVWAFGCLLFEMLSGGAVFRQSTMDRTLNAVVEREPDWNRLPSTLPSSLVRLLKKCLAKDVRRRLRSLADAGLDLEDDAIYLRPEASSRKRKGLLTAGVALAVLAIGLAIRSVRPYFVSTTAEILQTVQLTTYPGSEVSPSISPDGSQFAFAWNGGGDNAFHIYLKRFDTGEPAPLTRGRSTDFRPAWSPDGLSIAFIRADRSGPPRVIIVPSLGGREQTVVEGVVPNTLDWSPDGNWLVYQPQDNPASLWVQHLDGTGRHRVMSGEPSASVADGRFSPDGRSLAFAETLDWTSDVYVQSLDSKMNALGGPRRLTNDGVNHRFPQWWADGAELVVASGPPGGGYIQRMPASGGAAKSIMTVDVSGIALSPRTSRLLVSRSTTEVDIYRVELSTDGAAAQKVSPLVTSSRYDNYPVYSSNGERIAFASSRSGNWQIWVANEDGTNPVQLTNLNGGEVRPTSWRPPDGRQIGFVHNSDGIMRAYQVAASGGAPQLVPELAALTTSILSFWWSPNGGWIVYSTRDGVWKIPTGGGARFKLGIAGGRPDFEGTAAVVVHSRWLDQGPLRIVPLDGSEASVLWGLWPSGPDFSHGPRGLYYEGSLGQLMVYQLPNGKVSSLDGATAMCRCGMTLSPNGRFLLYSKFVSEGADMVFVENFR